MHFCDVNVTCPLSGCVWQSVCLLNLQTIIDSGHVVWR